MELVNGSSTSITRYINFTICGNPLPQITITLEDTPVHAIFSVTPSQKNTMHVAAKMADIGSKDCGKRLAVDMEEFFANTYELVVSCKFNVIHSRTHYYFFEVCCDKNITLLISLSIFTHNGVIFLSYIYIYYVDEDFLNIVLLF